MENHNIVWNDKSHNLLFKIVKFSKIKVIFLMRQETTLRNWHTVQRKLNRSMMLSVASLDLFSGLNTSFTTHFLESLDNYGINIMTLEQNHNYFHITKYLGANYTSKGGNWGNLEKNNATRCKVFMGFFQLRDNALNYVETRFRSR